MFGNFWGTFNVTGVFQSFSAAPGNLFEMDAWSRHFSGDALTGGGAPNNNWVVMKIAFFDGSQTEIGGVETTILDGTFATDVWHDNQPIRGIAPPGTTCVQPLVIYLQPLFGAGACHVDDLEFQRAFGVEVSQDPATLDLSVGLSFGEPLAQFGFFYSFDAANGTMPGMGGTLGGLFIDPVTFNAQLTAVFGLVPPYGGFLDGAGGTLSTLPGGLVASLSGATVWALGAQQLSSGTIDFSPIRPYTFQ
ncbi:MAG: hypothetical protein HRU14_15920 [Planctomycetes bacterium]|nr:hypothetical protein [Planctomycetota bacterium]